MGDYRREEAVLEQFKQSRKIPGTRKLHSFIPISHEQVEVRHFSKSKSFRKERVTLCKNDLPLDSIAGFVTCLLEGKKWLACEVNQEESKVNLTFLPSSGPSNSFKYPEQDVHSVPLESILTLVDPRIRTSRVFVKKRSHCCFQSTFN